jgi:hypothetical protein
MQKAVEEKDFRIFEHLVTSNAFQNLVKEENQEQPAHFYSSMHLPREALRKNEVYASFQERRQAANSIFTSVYNTCVKEKQPKYLDTLCKKAEAVAFRILDSQSTYHRQVLSKAIGTNCYEPFRSMMIQYEKFKNTNKYFQVKLNLEKLDAVHKEKLTANQVALAAAEKPVTLKAENATPGLSGAEPSSSPIQQVFGWSAVQIRSASCPPPEMSVFTSSAPRRALSAQGELPELSSNVFEWPTITGPRAFAEQKS